MDPTPSPPVASKATTTKISARPPATNGAVSSGRLVAPAQQLVALCHKHHTYLLSNLHPGSSHILEYSEKKMCSQCPKGPRDPGTLITDV